MLLDFGHRDRINAAERFVQHDHLWIGYQRTGNSQSPFLTATKGQCLVLSQIFNAELAEQLLTALLFLPAFARQHLENCQDILLNRELSKDRLFLGEITHAHSRPPMHREMSHIAIIKKYPTTVWPHETHNKIESGSFTSTIWTQ